NANTAHYGNNKVGQRRENQQDRIAQGIKSGQLTPGETAKLEKQQKTIHKQVAADRKANGGTLTASEKKQVNREQNQASRNIYRKKHNANAQPRASKKKIRFAVRDITTSKALSAGERLFLFRLGFAGHNFKSSAPPPPPFSVTTHSKGFTARVLVSAEA